MDIEKTNEKQDVIVRNKENGRHLVSTDTIENYGGTAKFVWRNIDDDYTPHVFGSREKAQEVINKYGILNTEIIPTRTI